jgi:serine/threonine-protein kinase
MDAEQWRLVQELFDGAVDLPPAEREAFLHDRCGSDEKLLEEVLSLIGADEKQYSLLDRPATDLFDIVPEVSLVGRSIGAYRIVEKIAAGGMGAVFLAERADGQYSQKVALKLIKPGMNSEEVLRRFRSERQILAGLNHPNISSLVDGGLTDDGLPWFAMEYVEGEPIDTYCDRRRLTIDDRLRLFLVVCRAVQYAQQNLVVHRDLKPSNILVSEDGTVKLLDFGIAKLLDEGDARPELSDLTRTGLRVMTPGYASPEQVRGDLVTTASDVYSLGVVLYRLLTGSPPYQLTGSDPLEMEKAICHTAPEKPSQSVTHSGPAKSSDEPTGPSIASICWARRAQPAQLRRRLAGDLDNICLMALRKERERRYQSADQLADDIERHLDGHPVVARKDSLGYRTGKFCGRHKIEVFAAVVLLVVISSVVVFYTARLTRERDRAGYEAAKAAGVSEFLTGLFTVADPNESRGETVTARELLDRGAVRIQTELSDQPQTQAEMLAVVGKVYHQLGLLTKADSLITEAMNLQIKTLGRLHPDASATIHELAVVAYDRGQLVRSEALYREALEIDRQLWGEEHQTVAADCNDLAAVLRRKGEIEEATELFERAFAMRVRLLGENHPDVAHSMNHLGGLLHDRGQDERAEQLLRKGLEIRRNLYGDGHFEVVASLGKLARFLRDRGDYEESKRYYREGIQILHKLVGDNHHYVGDMSSSLAYVLYLNGEYDEADSLFRTGLAVLRRTLPPGHVNLANPMAGLGRILLDRENPEAAEPFLREANGIREASLPSDHERVAQSRGLLGICLAELSQTEEAEPLLQNSLFFLEKTPGPDDGLAGQVARALATLYDDSGQTARADSLREHFEASPPPIPSGS